MTLCRSLETPLQIYYDNQGMISVIKLDGEVI